MGQAHHMLKVNSEKDGAGTQTKALSLRATERSPPDGNSI